MSFERKNGKVHFIPSGKSHGLLWANDTVCSGQMGKIYNSFGLMIQIASGKCALGKSYEALVVQEDEVSGHEVPGHQRDNFHSIISDELHSPPDKRNVDPNYVFSFLLKILRDEVRFFYKRDLGGGR